MKLFLKISLLCCCLVLLFLQTRCEEPQISSDKFSNIETNQQETDVSCAPWIGRCVELQSELIKKVKELAKEMKKRVKVLTELSLLQDDYFSLKEQYSGLKNENSKLKTALMFSGSVNLFCFGFYYFFPQKNVFDVLKCMRFKF